MAMAALVGCENMEAVAKRLSKPFPNPAVTGGGMEQEKLWSFAWPFVVVCHQTVREFDSLFEHFPRHPNSSLLAALFPSRATCWATGAYL
jgi:hypothetical protein